MKKNLIRTSNILKIIFVILFLYYGLNTLNFIKIQNEFFELASIYTPDTLINEQKYFEIYNDKYEVIDKETGLLKI
jgi:hypothetical protein